MKISIALVVFAFIGVAFANNASAEDDDLKKAVRARAVCLEKCYKESEICLCGNDVDSSHCNIKKILKNEISEACEKLENRCKDRCPKIPNI